MNENSTNLLLVGVGSGGCRFASEAALRFGPGIQAIGFDTDADTTRSISGMRCMLIGATRYDGRSTGGDPVKGRTAASDDAENIRNVLKTARLAVVVTTLGGGVGTGATPEILSILRGLGATTLCVATLPFEFEGKDRVAMAQRSLPAVEENADALVALKLDDLYAPDVDTPLAAAMTAAADKFSRALTLMWSILLSPGYISIGPEKLATLLRQSGGRCRFAVSSAEGVSRAAESTKKLLQSEMLGVNRGLDGVQAVLLGVLAGSDLRLVELSEISSGLRSVLPSSSEFNLGTVLDERFAGQISLVAIFFDVMRVPQEIPDEAPPEDLAGGLVRRQSRKRSRSDSILKPGSAGRFKGMEGTFVDGEDLDVPTYLRMHITLDR